MHIDWFRLLTRRFSLNSDSRLKILYTKTKTVDVAEYYGINFEQYCGGH